MNAGIESLFPPALGLVLLLAITGVLFAAPVTVAFLLTGILFFAGGLIFGRTRAHVPWGAGIALLAPFLAASIFIVAAFGSRFLLFPGAAAGGVASGLAVRRLSPGSAGPVLGALWIGLLLLLAFLFAFPSPLHGQAGRVRYPATPADHDDRVVPAHTFKCIATLQERQRGPDPVLVRIDAKSGHHASNTMKEIEKTADIYSFMLYNLGVTPKF